MGEMTSRPCLLITTIMDRTGATGVQTHVAGYARVIDGRDDIDVEILTSRDIGWRKYALFGPRALIRRLSPARGVQWYYASHEFALSRVLHRRVRELTSSGRTVHIHAQEPSSVRAARRAIRRLPVDERSLVVVGLTVHFSESQALEWVANGVVRPDSAVFHWIERIESDALHSADFLAFVSAMMRDYLLERHPELASVPHRISHNGVEIDPAPPSPDAERGDLISIGTLETRKNQIFLLDVVAAARAGGCEYTLTLVGDGPDRRLLETRAAELGIGHLVRFLGYRPHAASLLPNHRAYVHGSFRENFSIALIEALAAGLPVFARPRGGVPEAYSDGDGGRYWEVEDATAAAAALTSVLENPTELARMSSAARARANQFAAPKVYGELADFALAQRPRAAQQ